MKSETRPIKVTAKLYDGRVNSPDGLFFLDSILYHAWFRKHAPEVLAGTAREPAGALHFGLPLRQLPGGRYAASCGFYEQYSANIEYWNKRPDFMGRNAGYLEAKGKIDTGCGELKAYHFPQVIRTIGDVEFYAYGNPDKVRELLGYIDAIGKKPAAGWGRVREWIVEDFPEDWSTEGEYGLMRPMPVEEYQPPDGRMYRIGECAVKPPAWKACNQVICYIPEVILNGQG